MKQHIKSEAAYKSTMDTLYSLMNKGEHNLADSELKQISELGQAAQEFEHIKYNLPTPDSLGEIVTLVMSERNMSQKILANILNISESKLSLILKGKQRPDIEFLKGIRRNLNIDADVILEYA